MAPDSLKQFNVYLPPELVRALKHHAVDVERSLSAITADALNAYLAAVADSQPATQGDPT